MKNWHIYFLAAAASAIVTWSAFAYQSSLVWLGGVSGHYIESAVQLANGNGFSTCLYGREVLIPPGFSFLLAGLMKLGMTLLAAAQLLGVLSSFVLGWSVAYFLQTLVRWQPFVLLGLMLCLMNLVPKK